MEKLLFLAVVITVAFSILKYLEMRYLDKDKRSIKIFLRDAIYVFCASFGILYLAHTFDPLVTEFFHFITGTKRVVAETTQVFTGEPGF